MFARQGVGAGFWLWGRRHSFELWASKKKMKTIIPILILSSIFISCKDEIKENPISKLETEEVNKIRRDTFSFDAKSEEKPGLNLMSELKPKLEKLALLENNYQILKLEESTLKESIVYRGIERLSELSFKKQFFEIKNLDKFKDNIEKINWGYIKGTKDIGDKLFPRAKVEELIFKSDEIANKLVDFIKRIKEKGSTWEDIDKSPNSIFNEGNKVYYISSGGWYMKPFYQEIEKKMKK
ncbi:MAG: hypothetical protein DHS20C18_56340 [Saprospiraceae bacterium]|nr:MAG: hypothetical protein DHS20C18_56340 [Saprospiraceae bacterium]